MPVIELQNILNIGCNTIGREKEDTKQTAAQTDIVPMMLEVSSAVQTQGWKGVVQEQTATYVTIQTQAVIQI